MRWKRRLGLGLDVAACLLILRIQELLKHPHRSERDFQACRLLGITNNPSLLRDNLHRQQEEMEAGCCPANVRVELRPSNCIPSSQRLTATSPNSKDQCLI